MILSFIGSQEGMTQFQAQELEKFFSRFQISQLNHGDSIGSDVIATKIALKVGCRIFKLFPSRFSARRGFIFPHVPDHHDWIEFNIPDNEIKVQYKLEPLKKPLDRNKDLVNESKVLLVTPKEFKFSVSSATWSTVRYAWKLKKEVIIIPPKKTEEELNDERF